MIRIDEKTTYEDLREAAREQSRGLSRYSAVVEIVTYMQGRSRTTVMTSTGPIRTSQRGGSFIGVMCQFKDGEPYPCQ